SLKSFSIITTRPRVATFASSFCRIPIQSIPPRSTKFGQVSAAARTLGSRKHWARAGLQNSAFLKSPEIPSQAFSIRPAAPCMDNCIVTRNLTLNLRLRWQYETPLQARWSQQSQFNPTAIDPLTGLKGASLHPKVQLAKKDLNNFQPRIGLAYNFRPKWVLRG